MNGQPFFFDKIVFDDDPLAGMEEENSPAKPEFTKEEMEHERGKAFQAGKKAGFQESEAGLTKNILLQLQKIERDMSVLFAAEDDRGSQYEEEAVHLSLSILQKLFPLFMQEYGEKELKLAIKSALSDHNTPEKVKIELQNEVLAPLKGYIKELEGSLGKQITLTANPSFQKNECRILWPDGGIICNRSEMAEKTLSIMKEALAERSVSVHDESKPISSGTSIESEKNNQSGEA